MRKFLAFIFIGVLFVELTSAQNLSFTCPRNITVSCGPACLTLNAQFPDIRSLSTDYTVSNMTATANCYPLVSPGAPGQPTSITIDDTYSPPLPLTFNFPFYGLNNSQILVSTNGYLCFDLTQAGAFSHYGILNNGGFLSATSGVPQDLPSILYDKSLIMGPYHDLDPSQNTSPTRLIKYDVIGTAPTRKWIASFYKEPLYLTACNNLIQNTAQIILYESSGIIEVTVLDQQICNGWNQGRAMIGLQDDTRSKGITAPNRAASSTPWGTPGMNETYRFIPVNGTPLYRGAQLLDATGAVVATGDTSRLNANTFQWNFTSVCVPPNVPTLFVVKTTYQRIDNAGTFFSLDSITVTRQNSLSATLTTNPTTCGTSTGSITITPTAGTAPYNYTLNGGSPATAPGAYTYSGLAAGLYTIVATDATGCTNSFMVTVTTTSTIPGTATTTATTCPLSTDGTITVTPTGGTPPFTYSLDGGPSQASNIFLNVPAGTHTVTFTDAIGCTGSVTVTVSAGNTPLTATVTTTSTSCPTVSNGTITVTPTSGTPAYQYSLDGGPFQPGNIFINVAAGAHTVSVKDLFGCTGSFPVNVVQGTSLTSIVAFTNPPCNNVNDGTITVTPTSGTAPYQYSLNGGPNQPSNTFTGLAPGAYTINFTDAIGCTGTNSVTLITNPPITAAFTATMPLCNGASNGTIIVTAGGGAPPYKYSIDGGVSFQVSPVFGALPSGNYNFIIKDSLGCVYIFTYSLNDPPFLTVSAFTVASTCNGNDGTITVTASGGTVPYQYSIDNGLTYQPSPVFTVVPGVYDSILVRDTNNCVARTTAVVALSDTMRLVIGPDTTICVGKSVTFAPQTNPQTNIFKWTASPTLLQTEIDKDSIANATVTPPLTKKYYLFARWGVCQRTDSIVISVLEKPVANAGNDTTICAKTPAFLDGSASDFSGPLLFSWAPNSPLLTYITPDSSRAIVLPDSTQAYIFNVRDNYGCSFSVFDTMTVFIDPPVPAFAGNDTNAVLGQPHQLFSKGGVSYLWSPAVNLNNPFIQNPKAVLFNDTYFRVTVTDAAGCTGFDDVFVKVYQGPTYYVPNAFSPNKDGLNEVFRPIPVGIAQTDYFMVFDRYGNQVFQTNQWLKGWDGTFKGKDALMGTYVWMVKGKDKNGQLVEMKGTVLLLR